MVDLLRSYFHLWRLYRLILARLRIIHGVKRRSVRLSLVTNGPNIPVMYTLQCWYFYDLYSMRWLKYELKRLGLKRRGWTSLTPIPVVYNCIQVIKLHIAIAVVSHQVFMQHMISESGALFGYRTVWKILRDKYKLNVKRYNFYVISFNPPIANYIFRYTVMRLLPILNPARVKQRGTHRIKRRIYTSKVCCS